MNRVIDIDFFTVKRDLAALGIMGAGGGAGFGGGEFVLERVNAFGAQGGELGFALFDE